MSYHEADLSKLRLVSRGARAHKVAQGLLAHPPGGDTSFHAFLDSLPDQLGARHLRTVIAAVARAAREKRGVVVMLGGHVIKVGLGPLLVELIRRKVITHVAMNGSGAIHDWELAVCGETSEDVAAGLVDGTFGMVAETGEEMNGAIREANNAEQGLGEGLARALGGMRDLPGWEASILLACLRSDIPVSVHAAIGAETIHQHPAIDGAALGATTHRDFLRLAGSLPALHDGGVVLNLGSAVIMPEVFLKALTIARNLGQGRPTGFLAADFDMIRHYRPRVNVVERPTQGHGTGVQLTGHHEIMVPLLVWGVLDALDGTT